MGSKGLCGQHAAPCQLLAPRTWPKLPPLGPVCHQHGGWGLAAGSGRDYILGAAAPAQGSGCGFEPLKPCLWCSPTWCGCQINGDPCPCAGGVHSRVPSEAVAAPGKLLQYPGVAVGSHKGTSQTFRGYQVGCRPPWCPQAAPVQPRRALCPRMHQDVLAAQGAGAGWALPGRVLIPQPACMESNALWTRRGSSCCRAGQISPACKIPVLSATCCGERTRLPLPPPS